MKTFHEKLYKQTGTCLSESPPHPPTLLTPVSVLLKSSLNCHWNAPLCEHQALCCFSQHPIFCLLGPLNLRLIFHFDRYSCIDNECINMVNRHKTLIAVLVEERKKMVRKYLLNPVFSGEGPSRNSNGQWVSQLQPVMASQQYIIGPSGVRALPLAAGINEGGHYFRY